MENLKIWKFFREPYKIKESGLMDPGVMEANKVERKNMAPSQKITSYIAQGFHIVSKDMKDSENFSEEPNH